MKFVFASLASFLLFTTALSQGPYQLFGGPPVGPIPLGLGPGGGFGGPAPIFNGAPFVGVAPGGGFGGSSGPFNSFGPPFSGPQGLAFGGGGGGAGGGGGGAGNPGASISGYTFHGIGSPIETSSLGGFALGGRFGGLLSSLGGRRR